MVGLGQPLHPPDVPLRVQPAEPRDEHAVEDEQLIDHIHLKYIIYMTIYFLLVYIVLVMIHCGNFKIVTNVLRSNAP